MMENKFKDYQIKRTVEVDIAEHETHLSFHSDWQSIAFQDWFNTEGATYFEIWLQENREDYE